MRVYRQDFQILSSDVNISRTLRLSTLFTRLQEAAIAHTIDLGITREKTLDKGLLWAVTQYHAIFHRIPEYDEKVTLLTWPGKTMHLYFPRYFRLVDAKGSVLMEAVSLWVLIDQNTRGIVFPESYDIYIKETTTGNELAVDSMPEEFRERELRELSSEHIGEAQMGDVLSVGCSASEDAFYICGEKEKPVFRMKFIFDH